MNAKESIIEGINQRMGDAKSYDPNPFCYWLTCAVLDQSDANEQDTERVVLDVKRACDAWLYARKVLA